MGWGGRREAERTGRSDEAEVVRYRGVVDDSVCDHDEDGWDGLLVSSVRFQESVVMFLNQARMEVEREAGLGIYRAWLPMRNVAANVAPRRM